MKKINSRRKVAISLIIIDLCVIMMVVVIRGRSSLNVEAKDSYAAANILINSEDSLDNYKNNEIEQYISVQNAKKEEEEKKKKEALEKARLEQIAKEEQEAREKAKASYVTPKTFESSSDVANFAMQFVGNPYVAGGTSLTNGADCSGFVQAVYSNFGVSLPRTTSEQAAVGNPVSVEDIMPGDIVSYGYGGSVTHSALYAGDGMIVHASTPSLGIRMDNMYIMPIVTIRRVG